MAYVSNYEDFKSAFDSGDLEFNQTGDIVIVGEAGWDSPSVVKKVIFRNNGSHIITTDVPLFNKVGEGSEFINLSVVFNYEWNAFNIGAILRAQTESVKFTDCTVTGNITVDKWNIGGLCGSVKNGLFENCVSHVNLHRDYDSSTEGGPISFERTNRNIGQLAGYAESCAFTSCSNYGVMWANSWIVENDYSGNYGGIAGCAVKSRFDRCINEGTLEIYDIDAGGICGFALECCLLDCANRADVIGLGDVGGMTGRADHSLIVRSENHGTITGSDTNKGRLSTIADDDGTVIVIREEILGYLGGIAGVAAHSIIMDSYDSSASIVGAYASYATGANSIGGIVGLSDQSVISSCKNECLLQNVANYGNPATTITATGVGGIVGTIYDGDMTSTAIGSVVSQNENGGSMNSPNNVNTGGIVGNIVGVATHSPIRVDDNWVCSGVDIFGGHASGGIVGGIWWDDGYGDANVQVENNRMNASSVKVGISGADAQERHVYRITGGYYNGKPGDYADSYHEWISANRTNRRLTLRDNIASSRTVLFGYDSISGYDRAFDNATVLADDIYKGADNLHGEDFTGCGAGYDEPDCGLLCDKRLDTCPALDKYRSRGVKTARSARPLSKLRTTRAVGVKPFKSSCTTNPALRDVGYGVYGSFVVTGQLDCGDTPTPDRESIKLHVKSPVAKIPMVGGVVTINGIPGTIITGENGEMIICGIAYPGTYTVTITGPEGWQDYTFTLVINADGSYTINGETTSDVFVNARPDDFTEHFNQLGESAQTCASMLLRRRKYPQPRKPLPRSARGKVKPQRRFKGKVPSAAFIKQRKAELAMLERGYIEVSPAEYNKLRKLAAKLNPSNTKASKTAVSSKASAAAKPVKVAVKKAKSNGAIQTVKTIKKIKTRTVKETKRVQTRTRFVTLKNVTKKDKKK